MNWIPIEKEPKEEPNPEREVLVRYPDKTYGLERVDAYKYWPEELTHWAEIEGPDLDPHPWPVDPVEEAWKKYQVTEFSNMETPEFHFKAGWDAAIKYKEAL